MGKRDLVGTNPGTAELHQKQPATLCEYELVGQQLRLAHGKDLTVVASACKTVKALLEF